jgi:hypothetical protein
MASRSRHGEALFISSRIARTLRKMYWPEMSAITPEDVFVMLNEANVPFILMGTYGMTGWRDEPRASDDVDILVRTRDRRKAVQAIRSSLPSFRVEDSSSVTVFHDPANERPLIEVRRPTQPLFKLAFRQSIRVEEGYRIPNLEFALASKFAMLKSPNRPQEKWFLDAADFMSMAEANASSIQRTHLSRLGEKVYPGGGSEILQFVEDAIAGRRIEF